MLGLWTPRNGTTLMAMAEAIIPLERLQMFARVKQELPLALHLEVTAGVAQIPTEMVGPISAIHSSTNRHSLATQMVMDLEIQKMATKVMLVLKSVALRFLIGSAAVIPMVMAGQTQPRVGKPILTVQRIRFPQNPFNGATQMVMVSGMCL